VRKESVYKADERGYKKRGKEKGRKKIKKAKKVVDIGEVE